MVHHAYRPQPSAGILEAAYDLEVGDIGLVLLRRHLHSRLESARSDNLPLSVELSWRNSFGLNEETRELKVLATRPVLGIRTQPPLVVARGSLEDEPPHGVAVREVVLGAGLGVNRFRANLPHLPSPSVIADELPHRHRPLRISRKQSATIVRGH